MRKFHFRALAEARGFGASGVCVLTKSGAVAIALVLAATTGGARADDGSLFYKAQPVSSWTGIYGGLNAGYGQGRVGVSTAFCIGGFVAVDCNAVSSAGSPSLTPRGFTGGAQLGYNWQAGQFVLGSEIDFDYFGASASQGGTYGFPSTPGTFFSTATSLSTDWLMTVRPRAGIVVDRFLIYATGGLALTQVKFNQTLTLLTPFAVTASSSEIRPGWTVGAGAEWKLNDVWSAKLEYLYMNFGTIRTSGTIAPAFAGTTSNNSIDFAVNVVRLGVNYKFY